MEEEIESFKDKDVKKRELIDSNKIDFANFLGSGNAPNTKSTKNLICASR